MARWLGVDVGAACKGFDVAVVDEHRLVELGRRLTGEEVVACADAHDVVLTAIDSPRRPAPDGARAREDELQLNRAVCGIRWTPDRAALAGNPYYAWIEAGLRVFDALEERGRAAIEVFPTAAWTRWIGPRAGASRASWSAGGLRRLARETGLSGIPPRLGQDGRDAIAAAVIARLHAAGQTESFGEIVVPREPLPAPALSPEAPAPPRRGGTR